ncbi:MAG: hypothetical protein ACHQIM_16275 [Sphingobacteriales bacterium]
MENISIEKIEEIQESQIMDSFSEKVIDILLSAINDWPDEVVSLEDYELKVSAFIGGETTKKRIKSILKKNDISKGAWKSESLSQVIDMLELYDKDLSLKDVILELKTKLYKE